MSGRDEDALDNLFDEQEALDRKHGQFILDAALARRKGTQDDALLSILTEAWQSESGAEAESAARGEERDKQ
jgi:hypothetical protein